MPLPPEEQPGYCAGATAGKRYNTTMAILMSAPPSSKEFVIVTDVLRYNAPSVWLAIQLNGRCVEY